tara:strand:- start:8281 stop:8832 length:552 start_codon:yes stop_codon:yes gene_type:complete
VNHAPYDALAATYDELFSDPSSLEENHDVMRRIGYSEGSVLDIGCGTGLFLDHHKPDGYLGVDPSAGMLAALHEKHPEAMVTNCTFEDYIPSDRYDLIVSLFGSISYVDPKSFNKITRSLSPGGRVFLMFYRNDYEPLTHGHLPFKAKVYPFRGLLLASSSLTFSRAKFDEFGNFVIVEGKRR